MGKGCVRFKKLEDQSRRRRPHRLARARARAHRQLPGDKGAHGQGNEQRKEERQEASEEFSMESPAVASHPLRLPSSLILSQSPR